MKYNELISFQPIESVRNNAGGNVTFSFYAKADAAKNVAIEFVQNFGVGGSPSAEVTGIGAQKIAEAQDECNQRHNHHGSEQRCVCHRIMPGPMHRAGRVRGQRQKIVAREDPARQECAALEFEPDQPGRNQTNGGNEQPGEHRSTPEGKAARGEKQPIHRRGQG